MHLDRKISFWPALAIGVSAAAVFSAPQGKFETASAGLAPPARAAHPYAVNSYTAENGLPHDTILEIAEGRDGYLWLATLNGLVRYDGIKFTIFQKENCPQIPNNRIQALYADRDGSVWIGTEYGGLVRYREGAFEPFPLEGQGAGFIITSLFRDARGRLWIGTRGESLFELVGKKFQAPAGVTGLENAVSVSCFHEDSRGRLWIGTYEGLRTVREGAVVPFPLRPLPDAYRVTAFAEDAGGYFWMGTNLGLIRWKDGDIRRFTETDGLANNFVQSIEGDGAGGFWIGTISGLCRIGEARPGQFVIERMPESDWLTCLHRDREGLLWAGTAGQGLKRVQKSQFTTYTREDGLPDDRITCLAEDGRSGLWLGTPTGLIEAPAGGADFRRSRFRLTGSYIRQIAADKRGTIWAGTIGDGLFGLAPDGGIKNLARKNGLPSNSIEALLVDRENALWIGTDAGLARYRDGALTTFTTKNGLLHNSIFFLFEDRSGKIWIGTLGGVNTYAGGRFADFGPITTGLQTSVLSMTEDSDGILWAGTYGQGLCRISGERITPISEKDGLVGSSIFQIRRDARNHLWMCSEKGLFQLRKPVLEAFASGKIRTISAESFGRSEGLGSLNGRLLAVLKSSDGKLWIGTPKGLSVIDPENIPINKVPPVPIVESIVADDRVQGPDRNGVLLNAPRRVVFGFAAVTFIAPEQARLDYMLDGYDKSWRPCLPGMERNAAYQRLPAGAYVFKVRATNRDGIPGAGEDAVKIIVTAPWTRTTAFKIVLAGLVLMLTAAAAPLYRKVKKANKLKRRYRHSRLSPAQADEALGRLMALIREKKIYKNENVSLASLARELSVSPQHLSQIVNELLDKNFNDFINSFRVEEARRLMATEAGRRRNVLEIAYDVGFNSKSVFNKAFKKATGLTPSEYKKQTGEGRT